MSKEDGGPAFPYMAKAQYQGQGGVITQQITENGMSLRDYFASDAMKAALTAAASWSAVDFDKDIDVDALAKFAYKIADAMLEERKK